MLPGSAASAQILRPARFSTIALSLLGAVVLNFLPWPGIGVVPDFVALVLAFWCVRQPRLVGLGFAWVLGLVMDAGNGVLLGQHALAYSLLAFAAITLSRRILWFSLPGQALHVVLLLGLVQAVSALVHLAAGSGAPGWAIVASPLLGAVLWGPITWLLLLPQRRPAGENAPMGH